MPTEVSPLCDDTRCACSAKTLNLSETLGDDQSNSIADALAIRTDAA
jgi:hypothetical protein